MVDGWARGGLGRIPTGCLPSVGRSGVEVTMGLVTCGVATYPGRLPYPPGVGVGIGGTGGGGSSHRGGRGIGGMAGGGGIGVVHAGVVGNGRTVSAVEYQGEAVRWACEE